MTTPMFDAGQAAKDLEGAVAHLKVSNWGQGLDYDPDDQAFCAYGAIRVAVGGLVVNAQGEPSAFDFHLVERTDEGRERAKAFRDRASNVARAFKRVIGADVVNYNDAEGRTKAEVITALETVLAALREDPERAMGKEPSRV